MKETSTILYTFEDTNGYAEMCSPGYFNNIANNLTVNGYVHIELVGENERITVPLIAGYDKPYDSPITYEIGTDHYIYYQKLKSPKVNVNADDMDLITPELATQLQKMEESVAYFKDSEKVRMHKLGTQSNMKDISDGYHTFEDLYMHRRVLSSIIFQLFPQYSWKSRKHSDGEIWEGLFITGVSIPGIGDYSYHYHEEFWDEFDVPEVEHAPVYDGHKPEDIVRLKELLKFSN